MSQELRPDLTRTLAGCHRIDARMWQEQWPDVARILSYFWLLAYNFAYNSCKAISFYVVD